MTEAPLDPRSSYPPFQYTIADLLWLAVLVALLGGVSVISDLAVFPAIVLVLYVVKRRIMQICVKPMSRLLLFASLVMALQLYLYYCIWKWDVVHDAPRESSPLVGWIGMPIWLFSVPSASFVYDLLCRRSRTLQYYCLRSAIEVVVFIPVWGIVWFAVQAICFGWMWGS